MSEAEGVSLGFGAIILGIALGTYYGSASIGWGVIGGLFVVGALVSTVFRSKRKSK